MTEIKERGILFSSEMVRAILDDRKTETRRVMKNQPFEDELVEVLYDATCGVYIARLIDFYGHEVHVKSPYGKPGDTLYVRETFDVFGRNNRVVVYKASTGDFKNPIYKWKPSIHMPKKYSRIKLKIKEIRVERVQDITERGAMNEGLLNIEKSPLNSGPLERFRDLWDSLNKKRGFGWDTNCYVWVIKFERIK